MGASQSLVANGTRFHPGHQRRGFRHLLVVVLQGHASIRVANFDTDANLWSVRVVAIDNKRLADLVVHLLDRKDHTEGKALSKQVKQKRQDKAAKFNVPIPKVRAQSENEASQNSLVTVWPQGGANITFTENWEFFGELFQGENYL